MCAKEDWMDCLRSWRWSDAIHDDDDLEEEEAGKWKSG